MRDVNDRNASAKPASALDAEAVRRALAGCGRAPAVARPPVPACSQDGCEKAAASGATARPPALAPGVPPLNTFYIYTTQGCNQACRHCWIGPRYMGGNDSGGHVPGGALVDACRQALPLGLTGVKLTGGEPLLHPDFPALVRGLKDLGLNVWMESNLALLNAANAVAIVDGMSRISTSIDADNARDHDAFRGVAGSFATTCNAVRLLAPRVEVQVIMSVYEGNAEQIEPVIALSRELGARSVKFNLISDVGGRARDFVQRYRTLPVRRLIELGRQVEGCWGAKHGIHVHWTWPPAFYSIARLHATGARFCGIFGILGILASGHYSLCGIGTSVPKLVYGSLDDDLVGIWNSHPTIRRLREELPAKLKGVCAGCLLKQRCKAFCVANNLGDDGAFTGSHWFCRQAFDEGLFPLGRMHPAYVPEDQDDAAIS